MICDIRDMRITATESKSEGIAISSTECVSTIAIGGDECGEDPALYKVGMNSVDERRSIDRRLALQNISIM